MSQNHTYNGWTNYETWNLKLWMDNDEGSYSYWEEKADEICKSAEADSTFTAAEDAVLELAEQLKAEHEETADAWLNRSECSASWIHDFLSAALQEVNWHEIAQHYVDDRAEMFQEAAA